MTPGVRVVGAGIVTPLGVGLPRTWTRLMRGEGAIAPITRFDASTFPVRLAAQGPEAAAEDAGSADAVRLSRSWLGSALEEALMGLALGQVPPERRGVFVGAEAARPPVDQLVAAMAGHHASREVVEAHAPWSIVREVARRVDARGPAAVASTACTSSGQAVGEALLAIRRGSCDIAVAAGVDVLVHPLMVAGFARLGALSENPDPQTASRPFDVDRDGFVLGEGAGVIVLARAGVLDGREHGRILGYGCSSNAWRITDSPPDGRGAAQAMQAALDDAGVDATEVGWVHAHGTSTRQNDASEAVAIRAVLGEHADVAGTSSTKGALGHLVAASGVVGVVLALRALEEGRAPATRGLVRPDPACPVHHTSADEALPGRVALVNAFGFGGVNATVAVGGRA